MNRVWERVGDRILRVALSERKASACGWTDWRTIHSSPTYVLQRRTNTCNGNQQCRVSINGGGWQGASCP